VSRAGCYNPPDPAGFQRWAEGESVKNPQPLGDKSHVLKLSYRFGLAVDDIRAGLRRAGWRRGPMGASRRPFWFPPMRKG